MKTNIFDRIESISYFCHILLLVILLKSKYVEFINLEIKIPTSNTDNKIYNTTCHP